MENSLVETRVESRRPIRKLIKSLTQEAMVACTRVGTMEVARFWENVQGRTSKIIW